MTREQLEHLLRAAARRPDLDETLFRRPRLLPFQLGSVI